MSTEEHLKMFECLVDTGADVLRNLSEIRLLDNQKKSLIQFLEDERHYFYHQYEQKTLCCECSPHGCTIISTGKMESHIFNKVYYFDAKTRKKGHFFKNGMHNTQKCIHAFNPRNIILDDLDLSDLNYFLWTKGALSSQETSALRIIMDTRSRVSHSSSTTCIELHEINNMWATLENAVLDLSQPERYKKMVKMCIKSHRARQETEKILHGMTQIKETVKDELTKTVKDLTDESKEQTRMMGQLIGYIKNHPVFAQASPQVGADECQASGGNDQINMTTTLELPSLSKEEQRQIVETLPTEIKVGSEDEIIKIDGKQINSIVLDLKVSSSIFRDTAILRSALLSLIQEVMDKGKIDTNVQDAIYITLTFNSCLSSHEAEVLTGVLTQKMLDITDVESEGRIHDDTLVSNTFTPRATQVPYQRDLGSELGKSIDDEQEATYSCNSCQQKDKQILELGRRNRKLQESLWKLNRFLHPKDPKPMKETAIEDSDYMSFPSISAETWEEASNVDSDYMTHQPSAIKTKLEKLKALIFEINMRTEMEEFQKTYSQEKMSQTEMRTEMEIFPPDGVLWHMATPKDWDIDEVEATLKSATVKDEEVFKVKMVKKG